MYEFILAESVVQFGNHFRQFIVQDMGRRGFQVIADGLFSQDMFVSIVKRAQMKRRLEKQIE